MKYFLWQEHLNLFNMLECFWPVLKTEMELTVYLKYKSENNKENVWALKFWVFYHWNFRQADAHDVGKLRRHLQLLLSCKSLSLMMIILMQISVFMQNLLQLISWSTVFNFFRKVHFHDSYLRIAEFWVSCNSVRSRRRNFRWVLNGK